MMREYRQAHGLTQAQLAEEINSALGTTYDKALISKMESGMVLPPHNVESFLASKIDFKAVATASDARKDDKWVNTPHSENKPLKSAFSKNWNDKGLTQNERVLAYIYQVGSITSKEAFDMIGVTRLASRICDLTKLGYQFDRINETQENRYGEKVRFTKYRLKADEDGQEDMDR